MFRVSRAFGISSRLEGFGGVVAPVSVPTLNQSLPFTVHRVLMLRFGKYLPYLDRSRPVAVPGFTAFEARWGF